MSKPFLRPLNLVFIGLPLVIIAAWFIPRPSGGPETEEDSSYGSYETHESVTTIPVGKNSPSRSDEITRTAARTKVTDRTPGETEAAATARKEFWRSAKIPDDLIAASLPVLQAARPPESRNGTTPADLAKTVPGAFSEEENFNYKRANEELFLWLLTEPEAASAWLSEQDDFSRFDMAFGLVADAMASNGYPDTGRQWTDLIPDPARREDSLVSMYAGMFSRGEPIPENFRERVLRSDRID